MFSMQSLKQLLPSKTVDRNKYVSREWQDFGVRLAQELGDTKHTALYIKLAKTASRAHLEQAKRFVIDSNARNRGALFMWKLKQLSGAN